MLRSLAFLWMAPAHVSPSQRVRRVYGDLRSEIELYDRRQRGNGFANFFLTNLRIRIAKGSAESVALSEKQMIQIRPCDSLTSRKAKSYDSRDSQRQSVYGIGLRIDILLDLSEFEPEFLITNL